MVNIPESGNKKFKVTCTRCVTTIYTNHIYAPDISIAYQHLRSFVPSEKTYDTTMDETWRFNFDEIKE